LRLRHEFAFDPAYGHDIDTLLAVAAPPEPDGYAEFWRARYARTIAWAPRPQLRDTGATERGHRIFELSYLSTGGVHIHGWALLPVAGGIRRGFIVGHGYGGREGPDLDLPFHDAAILFPCARGLGRSLHPPISADPYWHVLHDIDKADHYVLGGCVDDVWLGVSTLLRLFPETAGAVGYLGTSFGGGIGVMATAWDDRIARAHVNVPSFGHHRLRLALPTTGSAASVQAFDRRHPGVAHPALERCDAAIAARHVSVPIHCACALFDPVVAPPGQFAIYNALGGPKELYLLTAGHFGHTREQAEMTGLAAALAGFFAPLDESDGAP